MPLNPTALERGPTLAVLVDRGDELALRDSEERWRELSRECQIAQQEAESANLAKSAFLAAMGHEFRTPMNSILGLTDLLLTRDPTPDQSNYLRKIHHAAKALQGLLNGILDYARIETNLMVIESLPVSFKDLFASSWHLFQQQASDKHLSLRFEVAPDVPPHLSGDPPRLQQVINHLVDNALKFTTQGGVDVLLSRAGPSRPGETTVPLRLAVTDTGLGLSTAEQERIFAPFQQIDMSSHRAQGGIGLGLTLCQRLVKLMGGEIGAESGRIRAAVKAEYDAASANEGMLKGQIANLRRRLHLIRNIQVFGVSSFFFCVLSMILLYLGQATAGALIFFAALLLLLISLALSLREVQISIDALALELQDIGRREQQR